MVNFDRLGARAGEKTYKRIEGPWEELPPKTKQVIRALIEHPELNQKEIAEEAGNVDPAHVHNVVYSLPKAKYRDYKSAIIQESEVEKVHVGEGKGDEDEVITVSAPMRIWVDFSVPKEDLGDAALAAIGREVQSDDSSDA